NTAAEVREKNRQCHRLEERRLASHIRPGDKTDADLRFQVEIVSDSTLPQKRMEESDCGKSRGGSRIRPAIFQCCGRQAPHRFNAAQTGKKTEKDRFRTITSELVEIPSGAVGVLGGQPQQILDVRLRQ